MSLPVVSWFQSPSLNKISVRQIWWRSWKKRTRSTPTWFQRSFQRSWRPWDTECGTFRKWQQSQPWVRQMSRSWRRRSGRGLKPPSRLHCALTCNHPIHRLKKSTCRSIRWSIRGWWEVIPWMTSWRFTGSRWAPLLSFQQFSALGKTQINNN